MTLDWRQDIVDTRMLAGGLSWEDIGELRRNWIRPPESNPNPPCNYAEIPPEKEEEWLSLRTDVDKALFLSNPDNTFRLYELGRNFIEETLREVPPDEIIPLDLRVRGDWNEISNEEVWLEGHERQRLANGISHKVLRNEKPLGNSDFS